ncbi:MliC family protein [Pararhizobium mangrovi]|uniref:Lysozyme inhibitor n=1 Tax=Pararhizobium mangrovi TaxID=2590452 RepID=A0A506UHD5_9HYPH|nr:MliC family protein [Pararhizobium mangrovi]TPW32723.1 lysozyme inhibitor [Pararhizobium mangrovi]
MRRFPRDGRGWARPTVRRLAILAAGVIAIALPVKASAGLAIAGGSHTSAVYACSDGTHRRVHYVRDGADALAIVPVDGARRIFVNVLSGSGARYASGRLIWWTKGRHAELTETGNASRHALDCDTADD